MIYCFLHSPVALCRLAEVEQTLYTFVMFFVYCIFNKNHNKIYIGQTSDIHERIKLHNNHEFKKGFTSRFSGEWKLVYSESFQTRLDALKREKQLKSFRGREFIKKNYIPL